MLLKLENGTTRKLMRTNTIENLVILSWNSISIAPSIENQGELIYLPQPHVNIALRSKNPRKSR